MSTLLTDRARLSLWQILRREGGFRSLGGGMKDLKLAAARFSVRVRWLIVSLGPKRITQTIEKLCSGLGTMVGLSTEEIDERVASLFQSDAVLPRQYLEADCRKTHLEAEHGLMLAVLEDAVTCFQKYFAARHKIGMRPFGEAEEWILLQGKPWIHP